MDLGYLDFRQTPMIWHQFGAFLAPSGGCVWAQASAVLFLWPWSSRQGFTVKKSPLAKSGCWGCTEAFCPSRHWRSLPDSSDSTSQLQLKALMSIGHRAESVVCAELRGHQVPSSEAVCFLCLERWGTELHAYGQCLINDSTFQTGWFNARLPDMTFGFVGA